MDFEHRRWITARQWVDQELHASDVLRENVPFSPEAERTVVGSILIDPVLIDKATKQVDHTWFYGSDTRVIFRALTILRGEGRDIDVVGVTTKLREMGKLDDCGGAVALVNLINGVRNTHLFSNSLNILIEKGRARKIRDSALMLAFSCIEGQFSDIKVEAFKQQIDDVYRTTETQTPYDVVSGSRTALDDINTGIEDRRNGIPFPTGIGDLDYKTGGLRKGELFTIGAASSRGKTSLASQIAWNLATKNNKILLFSTEMTEVEMRDKIIANVMNLDYFKCFVQYQPSEEDKQKIGEFHERFKDIESKMFVLYRPACTLSMIKREIDTYVPDFVFIDYLQQCTFPIVRERDDKQITRFCYGLKEYASINDCGVILTSQFNRFYDHAEREQDKARPKMSDLKDSGGIEQASNVIVLVWRRGAIKNTEPGHEQEIIGWKTELLIEKQRKGPPGRVKTIFRGGPMRFEQFAFDDTDTDAA